VKETNTEKIQTLCLNVSAAVHGQNAECNGLIEEYCCGIKHWPDPNSNPNLIPDLWQTLTLT